MYIILFIYIYLYSLFFYYEEITRFLEKYVFYSQLRRLFSSPKYRTIADKKVRVKYFFKNYILWKFHQNQLLTLGKLSL